MPALVSGLALLGSDATIDDDTVTLTALLVGQLFVWAFLLGAPLVATRLKGNGPVADFGLRVEVGDIPRGLAIGVLTQAVLVTVLYIPILWLLGEFDSDDIEREARRVLDSTSGAGLIVLFVLIVVLAPIIEELFFRGLLLRAIERRFGSGWAIAGSSILFGLSHLQGIQLPALVMFGAIAAVLTVRSGRLGPAIFAHIGFNGWTFAILVATQ